MFKLHKTLSLILCILLLTGCFPAAFAAGESAPARLYSFYGDDMLFQQNTPMLLAGEVSGGIHVTGVLLDAAGTAVAKGETVANKSNRFTLSLPAPKGGYDLYTVVLQIEGVEFVRLERVVFGELWMASGQSNMEYPLGMSDIGQTMYESGETGNADLHILHIPSYVAYEGDTERFPLSPQRDIPGAVWYTGASPGVWGMSAAAYFFADALQKKLDMPVGILNVALGGSSIYSWLSRSAIESDDAVLADLVRMGRFTTSDDWKETGHDVYTDITTNYNKKVQALSVFRPQGLLWYQGETELMLDCGDDGYARAFDLLQRSWTRVFGRAEDDLLPILYSGLAPYRYGGDKLAKRGAAFGRMQQQRPDSRAFLPIYDLPLTFLPNAGSIHPMTKSPVGTRMADAAMHLLYGKRGDAYTAPAPKAVEIQDGAVTVTFANTGDGLTFRGGVPHGFSVCGKDGVYVQADAEIVSADTVRIWAPEVPEPVSAAYALCERSDCANLFSTEADTISIPASPFETDPSIEGTLWQDRDYLTCDFPQIWHFNTEAATGYTPAWEADGAALTYTPDAVRGSALRLTANNKTFSVRSSAYFTDGTTSKPFYDAYKDYSRYGKMTFRVRNEGSRSVTLAEVRLYNTQRVWYAPAANEEDGIAQIIPADGQWHEITLDLDTLYRRGQECGATYSAKKLTALRQIELRFCGSGADAEVSVDEFRCIPDGSENADVRFIPRFTLAKSLWNYLQCAVMWLLSPLTK